MAPPLLALLRSTAISVVALCLSWLVIVQVPRGLLAAWTVVTTDSFTIAGIFPVLRTVLPETASGIAFATWRSVPTLAGVGWTALWLAGLPRARRSATRLLLAHLVLWSSLLTAGLGLSVLGEPALRNGLDALGFAPSWLEPGRRTIGGLLALLLVLAYARTAWLVRHGTGPRPRFAALSCELALPLLATGVLAGLSLSQGVPTSPGAWIAMALPALLVLLAGMPAIARTPPPSNRPASNDSPHDLLGWGLAATIVTLAPFLVQKAVGLDPPTAPRQHAPPASVEPLGNHTPFVRGVTLLQRGGPGRGYGSTRALAQLDRIVQLGGNAVALVPFAGTDARRPELPRHRGADAALARTLRGAKARGLEVLLKPQLWNGGPFTGDLRFQDEARFATWWQAYRQVVLHYARSAAAHDVDTFCIGTELGGVTTRVAAWRALIRDVRTIFPGRITYAAHWDGEAERLGFADALDLLGINLYRPLASDEDPTPDPVRVAEAVAMLAGLATQHGTPLLVTEVGFANSARAATHPWADAGRAGLDPARQAQAYDRLFRALDGQPWLAGLYLWSWPTHGHGHRFDHDFNLIGKPATEVIARWFGTWRGRPGGPPVTVQ